MDRKEINVQKISKEKKNNKILMIIILVLLLLDQITKIIFLKKSIIPTISEDESIGNGYYIIMSIIIVIMIIRYMYNNNTFIKFNTKIILSFAVAGAIGNVIDRIWRGYVITFINLGRYVSINLAYLYIMIMWVGFAIILTKNSMTFLRDKKKKKVKKNENTENKNK